MKSIIVVSVDAVEISFTYFPIQAAICLFMYACGQVPLILPKMPEQKSLTLY
jgi:hypothetical protein